MMVEQLDVHMKKYELSPIPYTLHTCYVKIDYRTRWNGTNVKVIGEKNREKSCDLVW